MTSLLPVLAGFAVSIHTVALSQAALAQTPAEPTSPASSHPQPDLLKQPTLYVVGYAHLDTQWRWTYVDSIRDYLPKTLHDNFRLFEKYPSYIFNFSGSRRYQMIKEYYPADFETMRAYIKTGRWFPCGSSVDENDANVPSAESFVRHVLYGNKYFRAEFGVASDEFMLPDCFGFPASMPTMLAHCGLKGFSTQKLTWNAVVPIPFKVGMWIGPDGTAIPAALDPGSYAAEVRENLANSNAWSQRIKASAAKSGVQVDYHYYGTGDTGGAPTERSVKAVEEAVNTNGAINVISSRADAMFQALTPDLQKRLPTYKGELMLTQHSAGAVTSQAYMKRWNRKNELLADAAEKASLGAWTMGSLPYPAQSLEDAWYLVLGSQMHDILPGTSLPRAYDLSWNDELLAANIFSNSLISATEAIAAQLDTRGEGLPIVVYNPLSFDREDMVEVEVPVQTDAQSVQVTGPDGERVSAQLNSIQNGLAKVAFVARAPSVGFSTFHVRMIDTPAATTTALKVSERRLENAFYVVTLDNNGDVSSILDKAAGLELLSAPIRLGLHYENPKEWPAWNQDWADRQLPVKAFAASPTSFRIIESGPARVAVEVTRTAEGSTFTHRIRLAAGDAGRRVEFDTDIDWRSRQRSLRVHFPLTVANPTATYDLAAGTIERGNGHENQYEYSFHQWFNLTDAKRNHGVTIMSDSKYGADKPNDHTLRLTLLHTPGTRGGYTDQASQDLGRHRVLFALQGHASDWRQAASPAQAASLNQPLLAFRTAAHPGPLGKSHSLMQVSAANVSISAAKKAEHADEVIIRLRELNGTSTDNVRIALHAPILAAREVDGQERDIGPATVVDGKLLANIHGYGLKAYALKLGRPAATGAPAKSAPITLPYDTDVVSTDAKRGDGDMDTKSGTYPAELWPTTLIQDGVAFAFGPTADGQKNALSCRGQTLTLPSGDFSRIVLLAAADTDTAASIAIDGATQPWTVQAWNGFIGQWDVRLWSTSRPEPADNDLIGLEPGYVKPDAVAWFASHFHKPAGNQFYDFCYIYKHTIDLPPGTKSITLPNAPGIKLFAATAIAAPTRIHPAAPLFDTLSDHQQDAPRIEPGSGTFTDATQVCILPNKYFRADAVYFTTDGSDPTPNSPRYTAPLTLHAPTTVKAAILDRNSVMSPIAAATLNINDTTPPAISNVQAAYQSPVVRVVFSEAVAPAAASNPRNYTISPAIAVQRAELQPGGRTVVLTLAQPPRIDEPYQLTVNGVADASPGANTALNATVAFTAAGPVYSLATLTPEQRGLSIRDIPNLPVKAGDSWTLNMFVKLAKPMPNRTIIAGFGKCEDTANGGARYIAKFGSGAHFWSRNQDVPSKTQLDLNRWQMLTATYDGTILRLYKDAVQIGEGAPVFIDDENVLNIAPKDPWEGMRQFEGELRDLSVWNAALSRATLEAIKLAAPK